MQAAGYREWNDAFNTENIPSTAVDKAFHLTFGTIEGVKQNQDDIEVAVPFTVEWFNKGFMDPIIARDESVLMLETLVRKALAATRRTQNGLLNVQFRTGEPAAFDESNDNIVMGRADFRVSLILDPDPS